MTGLLPVRVVINIIIVLVTYDRAFRIGTSVDLFVCLILASLGALCEWMFFYHGQDAIRRAAFREFQEKYLSLIPGIKVLLQCDDGEVPSYNFLLNKSPVIKNILEKNKSCDRLRIQCRRRVVATWEDMLYGISSELIRGQDLEEFVNLCVKYKTVYLLIENCELLMNGEGVTVEMCKQITDALTENGHSNLLETWRDSTAYRKAFSEFRTQEKQKFAAKKEEAVQRHKESIKTEQEKFNEKLKSF